MSKMKMSCASYDRSIKHALAPIFAAEAESYEVAMKIADLSDAHVMIDGQHVNPQRAGKSAEEYFFIILPSTNWRGQKNSSGIKLYTELMLDIFSDMPDVLS